MVRQPPASQRLPARSYACRGDAGVEPDVGLQLRDALLRITKLEEGANELRLQLERSERDRRYAERRVHELRPQVAALEAKVNEPPPAPPVETIKTIKSPSFFSEQVGVVYNVLQRYKDPEDWIPLAIGAVKRHCRDHLKGNYASLYAAIRRPIFRPLREAVEAARDKTIYDHLRGSVYTPEHFALLREVIHASKRSCALIEQSCKWLHHADGTKTRTKLAPGSVQNAPPLFDLCGICEVEAAEEEATKVVLRDHPDRAGCDVAGQPFGVDRVLMNAIAATSKNGTGGMVTAGTKEDPHIICETGDGAGLSRAKTGVHVSIFPGTTEYLNQSSGDVSTLLFYQVSQADRFLANAFRMRLACHMTDDVCTSVLQSSEYKYMCSRVYFDCVVDNHYVHLLPKFTFRCRRQKRPSRRRY